ncbi:MAG: DNA alkylation repair protein [Patescibacteria group bacterium]|nr:DNA alkylation repair protein [Patescibacteria group bacterium]
MFLQVQKELKKLANPEKARILARFFKTGKGEYGEGDKFLGIMTGPIQDLAGKYKDLSFSDLQKLLNGQYHEERTLAVMILIRQYKKGERVKREEVFKFYLKNTKKINNWNLVDISAPKIIGEYIWIMDNGNCGIGREILYRLARSENLWERRIAIISTFAFIRENDFVDTLKIAEILLTDKHDLIHKAVGWMLREIGKKDQKAEEVFLKKHYQTMPRTMLRYAIEKFSQKQREFYLAS